MCELPCRDDADEMEEPSKREESKESSVGSTKVVLDEMAVIPLIAGLSILNTAV